MMKLRISHWYESTKRRLKRRSESLSKNFRRKAMVATIFPKGPKRPRKT